MDFWFETPTTVSLFSCDLYKYSRARELAIVCYLETRPKYFKSHDESGSRPDRVPCWESTLSTWQVEYIIPGLTQKEKIYTINLLMADDLLPARQWSGICTSTCTSTSISLHLSPLLYFYSSFPDDIIPMKILLHMLFGIWLFGSWIQFNMILSYIEIKSCFQTF